MTIRAAFRASSLLWFSVTLLALTSCDSRIEMTDNIEVHLDGLTSTYTVLNPPRSSFSELFEYNRTIAIDSSIVVGSVNRISVGFDGHFLVIDKSSNQALLLDENGELVTILSPEECHPGFPWRPKEAKPIESGGWLILVNGPGGFMFDNNGMCTQRFGDNGMQNYSQFTLASSTLGYGLRSSAEGITIDAVEVPTGHIRTSLTVPSSNLLKRMVTLGGLEWIANQLLIGLPTTPIVAGFPNGGISADNIRNVGTVPGYYRRVTDDLSVEENSRGSTAIERMYEIMNSSSIVFDVHAIDDRTLAIVHYNQFENDRDSSRAYGLQVIDIVDRMVIAAGVPFDSKDAPIATGNGKIYSMNYTDIEYNPSLIEYTYKR